MVEEIPPLRRFKRERIEQCKRLAVYFRCPLIERRRHLFLKLDGPLSVVAVVWLRSPLPMPLKSPRQSTSKTGDPLGDYRLSPDG